MMEQFIEIKAVNPDSLLFYRMGDFYELFFHDAEVASRALGIALTKRGKHQGQDIPMCGVPVHAADDYLQKLIALGFRVAVCEQIEDPAEARKRGSKSVVKRDVVRLVTPGTITEDKLLAPSESSFLMALGRVKAGDNSYALAWTEISTGAFRVAETNADRLLSDIAAAPATARDGFDQAFGLLSPDIRDGYQTFAKQGWMCCVAGQRHLQARGMRQRGLQSSFQRRQRTATRQQRPKPCTAAQQRPSSGPIRGCRTSSTTTPSFAC
jgi:hypothetical protein